jgi:hypothetical protein
VSEFLLEFIREVDLGAEEDHTAARYWSWSVIRRSSNRRSALTSDGQVADEVVAVARREPLCQVCFWKLSTNDGSGLEGSILLQVTTELGGRCHESLLFEVTIRAAVLLGDLDRQVFGGSHVAQSSCDK